MELSRLKQRRPSTAPWTNTVAVMPEHAAEAAVHLADSRVAWKLVDAVAQLAHRRYPKMLSVVSIQRVRDEVVCPPAADLGPAVPTRLRWIATYFPHAPHRSEASSAASRTSGSVALACCPESLFIESPNSSVDRCSAPRSAAPNKPPHCPCQASGGTLRSYRPRGQEGRERRTSAPRPERVAPFRVAQTITK